MSEKVREEFNEWCRSIGFTLKMNALGNDYAIGYGLEQWLVWQASRAALVVELPTSLRYSECGYDYASEAFEETIDAVKLSLDSAGVGHK